MINFKNINEELKQFKSSFYERINHSYVRKFLDLPKLDDDKVFFLILMFKEKKIPKEKLNNYLFSALLVQSALDTHQTVPTAKTICYNGKKQRQLSVLAGDYYSSLYYYLLAKAEDVQLIRLLASAIEEVNESKMNLYLPNEKNLLKSFEDVKTVESSVLQKVADFVQLPTWKNLTAEFFFLKRLMDEKNNIDKSDNNDSRLKNIIHDGNKAKCIHLCDQYIELSRQTILDLCQHRLDLKEFFVTRIDNIFPRRDLFNDNLVEEG